MDDEIEAAVSEHLRDALKAQPAANDMQLAHFIASRTCHGGLTGPGERDEYEMALADRVRVRRHRVAR